MFKRSLLLVLLLIASFLFPGCDKRGKLPDDIQALFVKDTPDCLRIGLNSSPGGLNPILEEEENSALTMSLLHAGPLRAAGPDTYQGDLWKEWQADVDAQGNLVVTGTWRENLKWHDGTEFSPEDLSFTVDRMKDPKVGSPYRRLSEKVKTIEQMPGERKTRLTFDGNSRQYLDLLTIGLLPSHVLKEKAIPDATIKALPGIDVPTYGIATGEVRFANAPIGLGFYRISRLKNRRFMLLERSSREIPSDWELPPGAETNQSVQKILMMYYYYPEYLLEDLKLGNLDWTAVPSEFAAKIEEMKIPDWRFVRHPSFGYLFLGFNFRHPPFNSPEVRRALGMAIDRKKLAGIIPYEGHFNATTSLLLTQEYAPEKSVELLGKTGLTDTNGDGRRDWDGKPLKIRLLINQESLLRKMVAEEIAKQWQAVGLDVEVKTEPWSAFINDKLAKGDFDGYLLNLQLPAHGNWLSLWHSGKVPAAEGGARFPGAALNFQGLHHQELDGLLETLNRAPLATEATPLRNRVVEILSTECPGGFLFSPLDVSAIRKKVTGVEENRPVWSQRLLFWKK